MSSPPSRSILGWGAYLLLLSGCANPTPTFDAATWCAENPQAVVAWAGEEYIAASVAAGVPAHGIVRWQLDDTPTLDEHAITIDQFDTWRHDEPAAYERACLAALAAPSPP